MRSPNLLRVVIRGDISNVKKYLLRNSNLDPKEIARTLWHAIRLGHLEIALLLVKSGADLNLKNPFDNSQSSFLHVLHESIDPRYYQLSLQMLDYGADINACNENNESVLHSAIKKGKTVDKIEELMNRGARLAAFSDEIFRHRNAVKITQLLFLHGHTDELKDNEWVVHAAISSNNLELVQFLMEHGFDVISATKDGELPLYTASKLEKSTIAEFLIRSGAKVNAYSGNLGSDEGYPIHAACRGNSVENILLLLHHGADINLTNNVGETPFRQMNFDDSITDAHRIVIKRLAFLSAQEKKPADADLKIISDDDELSSYYSECFRESLMIKRIKIIKEVSIIGFLFKKDIRKLLFASRNYEFCDNIDTEQWKNQFPIYHEEMKSVFENVKRQKKFYSEREEAICESLENIIPGLPLERIIYFLYFN